MNPVMQDMTEVYAIIYMVDTTVETNSNSRKRKLHFDSVQT
jgi:hypothetical protein